MHHKLCFLLPVIAAVGCTNHLDGDNPLNVAPRAEDVSHDVEVTVDPEELAETFLPIGDRLVSPPVDLIEGAEQVGLMLTMHAQSEPMPLWVRGRDGDVTGAWHEVEWTFNEGGLLAGKGALDSVYLSVEVGLQAEDADVIDQLTFAPAVLADPSNDLELEDTAESEDGLAGELAFVGVKPRSAWGARAHRCSTKEPGNNYYRIAIHHTASVAGANVEAYIRQTQAYHMDGRGYCDVAYHFGVAQDGRIFELRPQPYRGGHTKNNNTGNVGVVFLGCFHPTCGNESPSAAAMDHGSGLLAMLNLLHGIPINSDKVRGHRDHSYASTACPGNHLYAQLGNLRQMANNKLAELNNGGGGDPPPPPAPAPAGCGSLGSGQSLAPGQGVHSCDGRFLFVHQTDGNVVLYKNGAPLWATGTNGQSTSVLAMQTDGNLVLYGPGNAVRWNSGTYGNGGAWLAIQNDGNVVIYGGGGALWHTHTYGH